MKQQLYLSNKNVCHKNFKIVQKGSTYENGSFGNIVYHFEKCKTLSKLFKAFDFVRLFHPSGISGLGLIS